MELGYLNSRIRAWRSELLSEDIYNGLIAVEDIKGLISRLRETIYARGIEIAIARYKNEKDTVEGGLKGNLITTFKALWDNSPAQARPLLKAIFSIWEVYNLKVILRARNNGVSPDESISVLIPAGEMDESALKELNLQEDIGEVSNLLSTWGSPYARPIKDTIQDYVRDRNLLIVELTLDRFVHSYCLSVAAGKGRNGEIIGRFVKERIDGINISTLLKLSGEGIALSDRGAYFLEGGERIDREGFLRLAGSKDRVELLKGLLDLIKENRWKRVIASVEPEDTFFLEEKLEELMREEICRLAVIEPLSIALAICFVYKKIREIKNLRLIVRAKIFSIPAFKVKRFIIL